MNSPFSNLGFCAHPSPLCPSPCDPASSGVSPQAPHLSQDTGLDSDSPLSSRLLRHSSLARLCKGYDVGNRPGGQRDTPRMCEICQAGDSSFSTRRGGALAVWCVLWGVIALSAQPCTLLSHNWGKGPQGLFPQPHPHCVLPSQTLILFPIISPSILGPEMVSHGVRFKEKLIKRSFSPMTVVRLRSST